MFDGAKRVLDGSAWWPGQPTSRPARSECKPTLQLQKVLEVINLLGLELVVIPKAARAL